MSIEKNFNELALSHIPFVQMVENGPDRLAVTDIEMNKTWTYKEFNREINKLAHAFQKEGLKKGDVIMASLLNGSDAILAMYAAYKTGAIYSPINFRLPSGALAYHLEDSNPKIYLYDSELENIVKDGLSCSKHKPQRVVSSAELVDYTKGKPETEPEFMKGVTPFDEALRLYTSGTTGAAKGVPLSHFTNVIIIPTVCWFDQWFPGDSLLALSPYFHRAGNHAGFMPALGGGLHVFCMKHFDPKVALDAIEREKISFVMGAPPMFAGMLVVMREGAKQGKKWNVSSLKGLDSMGAPLDRSLYLGMRDNLCKNISNSNGNTESAWDIKQGTWWTPPEKWETTPIMNGVGIPLQFTRVVRVYPDRKADPDDLVPRDGVTEGEMITKSLEQDDHYHNKPDRTAAVFRNGWFYTGDIVTWDKDGFISIRSRAGDMIKSGAEMVYPEEVEAVLSEHPKVADSAVVGVPDEVMGEKVAAYIVPKDPSLTAEELDKFLVNHPMLARYKRPRYYKFVKEVPYTATGKKIHYQTRDQAKEDLKKGELKAI